MFRYVRVYMHVSTYVILVIMHAWFFTCLMYDVFVSVCLCVYECMYT